MLGEITKLTTSRQTPVSTIWRIHGESLCLARVRSRGKAWMNQ